MWGPGTLVEFHFRGTLDDGSVFDSSDGKRARVFVLGRGQLLPAFEDHLRGLRPGEEARFRLNVDQAYGPRDPELVYSVRRTDLPVDAAPGTELPLVGGRPATVVSVAGDRATIDANHPLAGKALTFEVRLIRAVPAGSGAGP